MTFRIADEEYGVGIEQVIELLGHKKLTSLPNTPQYVKGVLNLRGSVVPIVDLRILLGMNEIELTKATVFIIVESAGRLIGLRVDSVADVVFFEPSEFRDCPSVSKKIKTDFIKGIAQRDEQLVILLNLDTILTAEDFESLEAA